MMAEKKKGIVMETSAESVIVLTPQGEFLQVPWSQRELPLLSSEIEFTVPLKKTYLPKTNYFIYMAASILLLVFVSMQFLGGVLPGANQVVAYVTLDINPSIELGINHQGKVIEVKGLNDDGAKILEKINVLELDVSQAVTVITEEAVKKQYLSPSNENNIVITISGKDKELAKTKDLNALASRVLEEHKLSGKADIVEIPMEIHDKAKELGVSPGKYVILLEALEQGLDVSLDDLKGNSIVKAIKKAGGVPGELIAKAQKDKHVFKELDLRHNQTVMNKPKAPDVKEPEKPDHNKDKKEQKDKKKDEEKKDERKTVEEIKKINPKEEKEVDSKHMEKKDSESVPSQDTGLPQDVKNEINTGTDETKKNDVNENRNNNSNSAKRGSDNSGGKKK
ncbi:MAG: hypothetical protein JG781_1692 [Peptococcaceae bacterium]|jgi:hypothetical protein|nr:hypothetical protein [Peptococcaceae bacterium]